MAAMIATAVRILSCSNAWNVWGVLTDIYPDATSDEKSDAIKSARRAMRSPWAS